MAAAAREIPEEKVLVTLIEEFNDAARQERAESEVLVMQSDFLRGLSQVIQERDPEAVHPLCLSRASFSQPAQLELIGNSEKIVAALTDIFREAHARKEVILSEALPGMGAKGGVSGFAQDGAREIVVTVRDTVYNLVKKENLPVRTF